MIWVFLLLIAGPLVELYAAIQVAHVIGGWNTILALLLIGAVGAWLLKRQGIAILGRARQAMAQGRTPDTELVDGILLAVAAGLMIAPGFLSDIVGIALLLPPTRALIRPLVQKRISRPRSGVTVVGDSRFIGTFRMNDRGFYDVDGHDRDDDRPSGPSGELRP